MRRLSVFYPKTSKNPKLKVIGTRKQVVLVGIPIINNTEMYVNRNPTSSNPQNRGLYIKE
jgi:hypothetical protein